MALGFRFVSLPDPGRAGGSRDASQGTRSPLEVAERLAEAFRAAIDEPLLQRSSSLQRRGTERQVAVHSAAPPVRFKVLDDGRLEVSARTSGAGPGYHAYLLDLLQRVSEPEQVSWIVDEAELGARDDTGYATHGDFAGLQDEMAHQLRALAQNVVHDDGRFGARHNLRLDMPQGYEPEIGEDVGTQRGLRRRGWLERVAESDDDDLRDFAAAHYPWWNRGFDAAFYAGWADVACWMKVRWMPPQDDAERALLQDVLSSFSRARELDPHLDLCASVIVELQRLLQLPPGWVHRPEPDRPGYRRRDFTVRVPPGWTFRVPGWFTAERNDEALNWWGFDRGIEVVAYSHPGDEVFDPGPDDADDSEPVDLAVEDLTVRVDRATERGGRTSLFGSLARPGEVLLMAVGYTDPADAAWAEGLFRSVRFVPERG